MSDAKIAADKYISRGGGSPAPTRHDFSLDLSMLANYILWHDPKDMRGSVYRDEAFAAMCRLLNVEQHRIRAIMRRARRAGQRAGAISGPLSGGGACTSREAGLSMTHGMVGPHRKLRPRNWLSAKPLPR